MYAKFTYGYLLDPVCNRERSRYRMPSSLALSPMHIIDKAKDLLNVTEEPKWCATFKSFCARILPLRVRWLFIDRGCSRVPVKSILKGSPFSLASVILCQHRKCRDLPECPESGALIRVVFIGEEGWGLLPTLNVYPLDRGGFPNVPDFRPLADAHTQNAAVIGGNLRPVTYAEPTLRSRPLR